MSGGSYYVPDQSRFPIFMAFSLFVLVMGGKKATSRVWEGAKGLEWTVASPAPYHTFSTPPKVD